MLSYCLKRRENTKSKVPKTVKPKKRKNNTFTKLCNL